MKDFNDWLFEKEWYTIQDKDEKWEHSCIEADAQADEQFVRAQIAKDIARMENEGNMLYDDGHIDAIRSCGDYLPEYDLSIPEPVEDRQAVNWDNTMACIERFAKSLAELQNGLWELKQEQLKLRDYYKGEDDA